jgi:Zn-dependent alcohol dehydrogenase
VRTRAAIDVSLGQPIEIDEIELPDPGPGEVALKLDACGICHSLLHQLRDPGLPRPSLLGHEAFGRVTALGDGVDHLELGCAAIVTWVSRAPSRGPLTLGPPRARWRGKPVHEIVVFGWAEDVVVDADLVYPVEERDATPELAVIGCAVMTGAGAVLNTASVEPGDSVAVFGAGGVGLSAIAAASIRGAALVICIDIEDEKLEFARLFGATHLVNSRHEDPVSVIREITGAGVAFAFDTIGLRETSELILRCTRSGGPGSGNLGGVAVLVGVPGRALTVDPRLFVDGQRQYRGSNGAVDQLRDFPEFLRWHREGRLPLDRLVTRTFRLDEVNEACSALASGEILGRALVTF